jgi:nucleoside-diphosphate-sugar epimerase
VTNYRSPDFDAVSAVQNNTFNLTAVLRTLISAGCGKVLLTGSVFEGGEGSGSDGLPDVSPYGMSKALTAQIFRHYCKQVGLGFGKFVIPNPFGPYEEPRFTAYLITSWLKGEMPVCSNPSYVRDNIHASLLAKGYVQFANNLSASGFTQFNPSGYVESQGAFTYRIAREMQPRLKRPCLVDLKRQLDFPEPRVRINTEALDIDVLGWDESRAWDDLSEFYQGHIAK